MEILMFASRPGYDENLEKLIDTDGVTGSVADPVSYLL